MAKKKGKLPKAYIKKYGISKAGWAAYRRGALSGAKKKKKVAKKKTTKRKTSTKKPTTRRPAVAKKKTTKKKTNKRITASVIGKSRRRKAALISDRTMRMLVDSGVIGGGALGTTLLVQSLPMVKDLRTWQKALIQALIGVFGITFVRNLMLKKAFSGSIVGSAITLLMPFMPKGFSFLPGVTAGGRPLTREEMIELTAMGSENEMGIPKRMGKPVKMGNRYTSMGVGYGMRQKRGAYA